jgi:hypothetical protein
VAVADIVPLAVNVAFAVKVEVAVDVAGRKENNGNCKHTIAF